MVKRRVEGLRSRLGHILGAHACLKRLGALKSRTNAGSKMSGRGKRKLRRCLGKVPQTQQRLCKITPALLLGPCAQLFPGLACKQSIVKTAPTTPGEHISLVESDFLEAELLLSRISIGAAGVTAERLACRHTAARHTALLQSSRKALPPYLIGHYDRIICRRGTFLDAGGNPCSHARDLIGRRGPHHIGQLGRTHGDISQIDGDGLAATSVDEAV